MYYGYIRVSTQTQAEHGQGLDTQKAAILAYCKQNNIELSDIYEDAGISGTILERPAFTDLLATIGKDDRIIVLNTSRLWRNDTVKVLARREIEKAQSDVISIEQPTYSVHSKDPNDFFVNSIMEILDQYDRMQISKKLASGRRTKAKKGCKACGTAPYGYKWQDTQIVIDYNNNLIVKDIFAMYAANNNLSEVARLCTVKGYKTSTGKDFSKQAISNIIHNDFYTGIVTHAGVKAQGTHAPIIDKALFDSVQG